MRRTQFSGLQIRRPADTAASGRWLLPILSGAAIYALLELTGMEAPWLPALTGAVVGTLALLFGKRKWFYSGALACLVLALLVLRGRITDGFCQWHNGMGAVYTAGSGSVLPALEASGEYLNTLLFTCWLAAAVGMGMGFLSKWGNAAVGATVLLLCGGVCLALGRMIDPLPLILAVAALGTGHGWKRQVLPLAILIAAVLFSSVPGFSAWAGKGSEAILQAVHVWRYETTYTTLPEGRLEPIRETDAVALVVTMEKPEVLYLRGFTGADFSGNRWLPLDPEILAEHRELLYWLNCREFDPRAQFEAASSMLETAKNTVTVQNLGACSAYRYIPFTICADGGLIPGNLTETAQGDRYDSFTTVWGGAAMLPEVLTALESESNRYLQAEAAYREFVQAHYLTVPEEPGEKMGPCWEKAEGMAPQQAVLAVLEMCWPDGLRNDPYCATAAVLTLRHFGIPARYAEGYIVPQTTATTVELTGRHAACWAEVYHDGIGWLPMALTPGLNGETQQEQQQEADTPEETLPPETEPNPEPEPHGGEQVRIAQVLRGGAIVLIIGLLLLILLLILRRKRILKKRQMILEQEDIREAVTWSFADSVRVLERMGIHRGNGSLDALTAPIRQRFGAETAEQFEAASKINARALFSGKPMTEPERETVHGFRQRVLSCLQADSNRLSGLWMKYILCEF